MVYSKRKPKKRKTKEAVVEEHQPQSASAVASLVPPTSRTRTRSQKRKEIVEEEEEAATTTTTTDGTRFLVAALALALADEQAPSSIAAKTPTPPCMELTIEYVLKCKRKKKITTPGLGRYEEGDDTTQLINRFYYCV